jgi:hypothetical protein
VSNNNNKSEGSVRKIFIAIRSRVKCWKSLGGISIYLYRKISYIFGWCVEAIAMMLRIRIPQSQADSLEGMTSH